MSAIKELKKLYLDQHRVKYPSMPEYARTAIKYSDVTANGLTKCIVDYITFKGGFASRLNSTGVYRKDLERYVPGTQKKGLPDVLATWQGQSLFIEVKIGRDRQNDSQKKIEQQQQSAGGSYYTARNFTDFKIWFDSF